MVRGLRSALVAVLLVVAASSAHAQPVIDKNRSPISPDQQWGFGINNAGLHIHYAMGPAFHLGINLNLDVNSTDASKPGVYNFGPYAKFLFSGGILKPFLLGAVGVLKPGTGRFGVAGRRGMPDSVYAYLPEGELSVKLAGGVEHFFSENVGLYGQVNFISTSIVPSQRTDLGLLGAVFGAEFFF